MTDNQTPVKKPDFVLIDHKFKINQKVKNDKGHMEDRLVEVDFKISIATHCIAVSINKKDFYFTSMENMVDTVTLKLFRELGIGLQPHDREDIKNLINWINTIHITLVQSAEGCKTDLNQILGEK